LASAVPSCWRWSFPARPIWCAGSFPSAGDQQVEGNVLQLLIQKKTVELPAVLALFSILAFGLLFGALGVTLGVPLTVVLLVALKELYI